MAGAPFQCAARFRQGDPPVRPVRRAPDRQRARRWTTCRLRRAPASTRSTSGTPRSSAIAASSSAAWERRSASMNRHRRKPRSAQRDTRSPAASRRPDASRAGTSSGSIAGRSPSVAGTGRMTMASRSCERLLADCIDELIVVPLAALAWTRGRVPPDVDHQPGRSRSRGRLFAADAGDVPRVAARAGYRARRGPRR